MSQPKTDILISLLLLTFSARAGFVAVEAESGASGSEWAVSNSASPAINLTNSPSSLMLTWPLASAGFTLQSRTNLVEGNWVNVASPAPQIVGGQWQVTLPPPAGADTTFYRLIK